MASPEEVTFLLKILTYRAFMFIFVVFIGVEIRFIYVMTVKKESIPTIFRIVIMQSLISHMGVKIFALIHHLSFELAGASQPMVHTQHEYCILISVMEHTCWFSNCVISTLHAIIRFNSIRRPLHYKQNWTTTRLTRIIATIWVISTSFGLVAIESKSFYNYMMQSLNVIYSMITLLLYIITLVYWKCVKDVFRKSIPKAVLRTTVASFVLSLMDIFGNILASYLSVYITLYKTLDEFMECKFPSKEEQKQMVALYREIVHLSYKFREIIFTILLLTLFRKVRRLFFGQTIVEKRASVFELNELNTTTTTSHV